MGEYYDRQGQPIGLMDWSRKFEDRNYKTVRSDYLDVGGIQVHVSTVWLGANHQWGDGPPLIFETMIFGGTHGEECWRYPTEDEALAGHLAAVALAKREGRTSEGAQ